MSDTDTDTDTDTATADLHVLAMDTQDMLTAMSGANMPKDTRAALVAARNAMHDFRALTFRDWLTTARPFDAAQD